jgi:hypothetical protein
MSDEGERGKDDTKKESHEPRQQWLRFDMYTGPDAKNTTYYSLRNLVSIFNGDIQI